MSSKSFVFFGSLIAAVLLASLAQANSVDGNGNPKAGKVIFESKCVLCHGVAGRGHGIGSGAQNPRPADFTDHDRTSGDQTAGSGPMKFQ